MPKKMTISQTVNNLLSVANELDNAKFYNEADTLTKMASSIYQKAMKRSAAPYNGYNQSIAPTDQNDTLSMINNLLTSMTREEFYQWAETPNGQRILNEKDRLEAAGGSPANHSLNPDAASDFQNDDNDYVGSPLHDDNEYYDHNGFHDTLDEEDPFTAGQERIPLDDVDNDPHAQYFK